MRKKKIIKALESKGYKVESLKYTSPSGGIADDYPTNGYWAVFIEGESIPIQGSDYKEVLKEVEMLPNALEK